MRKLVWISDYPLRGSSFANVTMELARRIKNYKVYILGLGYDGTAIAPFPDMDILPLSNVNQLEYYFRKLNPSKVVLYHSFYLLEKLVGVKFPEETIGYIPIEGEVLPENLVSLLYNFGQIITPSKYSQKVLRKLGLNPEVVPHGVDTSFFTPANKSKLREFRWGYLGMNDVRKQVPRIMEAYSRLPRKTRGTLTIASTQEGHYNLHAQSKSYGISPIWIEKKFYGIPMSRQNILEFYHNLSCYVNIATEAFGLPNLEAAACGIPTVALNHGASKEVLKGGALYVRVKDYLDTNVGLVGLADRDDLYKKMKIILEVSPERQRLIKNGLQVAKERTWEKASEKLEDVLD